MIPRECKRLAEVDFPTAEVSKHAAREKSIRHGHPSTLHLWWTRRPLASSRAVVLPRLATPPSTDTAMLLQSSGHANALRTLIDAEQDRGPDFLRLANALSALYPQGALLHEKR